MLIMRNPTSILQALTMLLIWGGLTLATPLHAQRLDWKLEDFKPLTEMPWSGEMKEPMAQVLSVIFHEPEFTVRMLLLDEYLRAIPDSQIGRALDICLELEGSQSPDDLVDYFISIWAKRDPGACWMRVKELVKVVGLNDGWLNYDGWESRSRITVQNWEAIKTSRFYLNPQALSGFDVAVEHSDVPQAVRMKYLQEFSELWKSSFGEMPSLGKNEYAPNPTVPLSQLFSGSPQSGYGYIFHGGNPGIAELAARRYIKAFPSEGPEIIKRLSSEKKPERDPSYPSPPDRPSRALFELWAEADLAGMVRWVDDQVKSRIKDVTDKNLAAVAQGILLSRVGAGKREQWLTEARETDTLHDLLPAWALSDPRAALEEVLKTKDIEVIARVVYGVAYGPQGGHPYNSCHPGLGIIRDFDFFALPKDTYDAIVGDGAYIIMEQWGEVDAAEAARFGIQHIFRLHPSERQEILSFFRGENDNYADEGDVLDRTFCALRVWAVTKPDEMKAWIATLKEEDLRKSLTWLLENPWGTGPEE
jgi:hypothetical protein